MSAIPRACVPLVLATLIVSTTTACDNAAAKKSEAAATVYLIELESGSESTVQRATGLIRAGKRSQADALLRTRLDGLEEQVAKYITTDPELVPSDRDRIVAAVRQEQARIRELLGQRPR
ncbi:MAG: hypothetical protein AB7Q16_02850 [Vicinamibacterales bacterium]